MSDRYVGAERHRGELPIRDNKEVYDAELFGIAMVIRHAAQKFGPGP
jgi:hypothetical protein